MQNVQATGNSKSKVKVGNNSIKMSYYLQIALQQTLHKLPS
jgi:hypothetical protein